MIVVVMGVTGSGKTTVGRALAERLEWPFYDADDLHPAANVEKMRRGVALTDDDRTPWLAALRSLLNELDARDAVLACSALRRQFRAQLNEGHDVRFVYLQADPHRIAARLAARRGHFMNPSLVQSQFEALEEPEDAITLDANLERHALVERIVATIEARR